jgi:hypothetical protein
MAGGKKDKQKVILGCPLIFGQAFVLWDYSGVG